MKFTKLFIIFIASSFYSVAQTGAKTQVDTATTLSLPVLKLSTEEAQNKLSWYCQYDGVKSIAVQRSTDSVRNFTTIGVITAPKKGNGTYKDLHPNVGKNYYRLSVEFGGDLEWFSNTYKVILDSVTIAKAIEARAAAEVAAAAEAKADAARKEEAERAMKAKKAEVKVVKSKTSTAEIKEEKKAEKIEKKETVVPPAVFTFVPSSKIFTNPYTGHININLPDALNRRYNIRFFDPSKNEVLRISRVSKPVLILDKNNFNSRGIYSFQLFDGTALVESGYVNIN